MIFVNTIHAQGTIIIVNGRPTSMNVPKWISVYPFSNKNPASKAFGAVPTNVAIPPIVAL